MGVPRWPVLAALTSAVLGVHLLLLAGGVPLLAWPEIERTETLAATPPMSATATGTPNEPVAEPPPRVAALHVSTVRWITPAAPVRTPPPETVIRPKPQEPAAPKQPQVATPAAAETQVAQLPSAPEEPAPAAAPDNPAPDSNRPETPAAVPAPDTQALPSTAAPPAIEELDRDQAPVDDILIAASDGAPTRPMAKGGSQPPGRAPASARLTYDIHGKAKGLSYSADAQLQWLVEGSRYSAEMEISTFLLGSRVQTSRGGIGLQGLMPERFGDRRRGTEKATHFDHARQLIRFSNNAPVAPLLPGAQDRLSVFLQLAALLNARPADFPTGQMVRLQVAGSGDAEVWSFQVGPEETLALPTGSVNARRFTRPPRREHDSTVDIWLAPMLQHLPVRIRITEQDGDMADQQLRQLPPMMQ